MSHLYAGKNGPGFASICKSAIVQCNHGDEPVINKDYFYRKVLQVYNVVYFKVKSHFSQNAEKGEPVTSGILLNLKRWREGSEGAHEKTTSSLLI